MCTRSANFVPSSFSRSAGGWSKTQSAWLFSTAAYSASTLRPNLSTVWSGFPSGCASFDHALKDVLRTCLICLVGEDCAHLYGPVPGGGMLTFLVGVEAGRMTANGSASLSRNSGSAVVRLSVTVLPLTVIPLERSQV